MLDKGYWDGWQEIKKWKLQHNVVVVEGLKTQNEALCSWMGDEGNFEHAKKEQRLLYIQNTSKK